MEQGTERELTHRIWVIADLQYPELAARCMETAIKDIRGTGVTFDQIWHLGDASTSRFDGDPLDSPEVTLLREMDVPVRFTMGNHDVDQICKADNDSVPMYDAVTAIPDWRTSPSLDALYFTEELGDFRVVFLPDHVDPAGRWCAHHGENRHGDPSLYPHDESAYEALRAELASDERPVILAGHNAFPGGNRPADLQAQLLPLPPQVRLHLHGHGHIGDEQRLDGHAYRTIAYVEDQPIPQLDVASLEDRRNGTIRSAVLELYDDQWCRVLFRDHHGRAWLEAYWQSPATPTGNDTLTDRNWTREADGR